MRIVDRDAFLSLPANTVYSLSSWSAELPSTSITELYIKGDTVVGVDYYEQHVPDFDWDDSNQHADVVLAAVENGENIPLFLHSETRNGMFDERQMYVVWDKQDIQVLIERLQECL
ncbi:hypothetical protein [Klebsiella variicola]|uniref:hypothetical protein n=1 Tax=Klebsiella variicola TaxID=244366 RepID=UPI003B8068AB